DLAISGDGFFIVEDGDQTKFTRAGQFGVDKDGFVVNNTGMRLQGFTADEDGNVGGIRDDIVVNNENLAPQRTQLVEPSLNLDSSELVLEERGIEFTTDGAQAGFINAGLTNSFPATNWTVTYADSSTDTLVLPAGQSAGANAAQITTALDGVEATATTSVAINADTFTPDASSSLTINGITFSGSSLDSVGDLAIAINSSALGGVNAVVEDAGLASERLVLTHNQGADLVMSFNAGGGAGTVELERLTVDGQPADATGAIAGAGASQTHTFPADGTDATISGIMTVITEEGATIAVFDDDGDNDPTNNVVNTDLITAAGLTGSQFLNNVFDPADAGTYNHSTSTPIYDSLGNQHVLSMYFVKQAATSATQANTWQMYTLINGNDIGDPVTAGGDPTRQAFALVFDNEGNLRENLSDLPIITNWLPLDANGDYNGADQPINGADGGNVLPLPDPPDSSNFFIDITNLTQYGSPFTIADMQQDGFTTGRLSGLDVDDSGIMFARYSNGESRVISQLAMASFNDNEGLSPVGDTAWVSTFESGDPIIGTPGTGVLGSIKSASLEESNVDLSDQLVNLIVAQRNYQANAKTIETADSVTQTIINLR
ncbi:MAG: flagellar hook-basal body complex protein, partial [Pseudomonadales bacterium]|nr:flagellar hook-basal body complex protein [Pseudomonadales bacterium]